MNSPETVISRSQYRHFDRLQTRWKDNDVYGHVNNVEYYGYFDTLINRYLIRQGGLDIHHGEVIGLCAESHCRFLGPLAFPGEIDGALRVGHLGRRSVRYEIALFAEDAPGPAAEGWFVHVFVDRQQRRPVEPPPALRAALAALERRA